MLLPNWALNLSRRLDALARVHCGVYSLPQGQRAQGAGSQLNPVR